MRSIKKRLLYCVLGVAVFAVAAVLCALIPAKLATIFFAAAAAAMVCLAVQALENYQAARLICENPILNVGVASVAQVGGGKAESAVSVVVSGFGILLDGKPYKFGHGGVNLTAAAIDRESITLSFQGEQEKCAVRLLHGIGDKGVIDTLIERLRYETGVAAQVTGW